MADWIAENGYTPVFSGSTKKWEAVEAIRHRMDHTSINLAGHCDLLTFAEVIGRSPCVVSVDSASRHMAVAMQTPVVALFGPTDSRRWGPYPNGCANVVVEKQGDCSFCKCQSGCPERAYMKMIETEEVIEAIGQVIYYRGTIQHAIAAQSDVTRSGTSSHSVAGAVRGPVSGHSGAVRQPALRPVATSLNLSPIINTACRLPISTPTRSISSTWVPITSPSLTIRACYKAQTIIDEGDLVGKVSRKSGRNRCCPEYKTTQ